MSCCIVHLLVLSVSRVFLLFNIFRKHELKTEVRAVTLLLPLNSLHIHQNVYFESLSVFNSFLWIARNCSISSSLNC
jgi:hypothetical protein